MLSALFLFAAQFLHGQSGDLAAKSAQAEARTKSKSPVEKRVINNTTTGKPLAAEAPDEQKPKPAKTPSLFEVAQEPAKRGRFIRTS